MTVRNEPESVSGINRNDRPESIGIGVRNQPEYAIRKTTYEIMEKSTYQKMQFGCLGMEQ